MSTGRGPSHADFPLSALQRCTRNRARRRSDLISGAASSEMRGARAFIIRNERLDRRMGLRRSTVLRPPHACLAGRVRSTLMISSAATMHVILIYDHYDSARGIDYNLVLSSLPTSTKNS